MDSMRSLNTSLPRSSPHRTRQQPPSEILSAFKAAALSVTQLYKTAAADQDSARAAGYQDAIEELLHFLDQENLGLGDGEGWRVRQWATERLSPFSHGSDGDADADVEGARDSPSPSEKQKGSTDGTENTVHTQIIEPGQNIHEEIMQRNLSGIVPQQDDRPHQPEVFHFRSNVTMPSINDTGMGNTEHVSIRHTSPSAVRADLHSRGSRSRNSRYGSGPKRKFTMSEFFDITDVGGGREGFGGSKRSRLS